MSKGWGSGDNGEFTFLDTLSLISFAIGLKNLDLNITQEHLDKQTADLKAQVDEDVNFALNEIHNHLQMQDDKINSILEVLNNGNK
mgnify:CR=1 FL=1